MDTSSYTQIIPDCPTCNRPTESIQVEILYESPTHDDELHPFDAPLDYCNQCNLYSLQRKGKSPVIGNVLEIAKAYFQTRDTLKNYPVIATGAVYDSDVRFFDATDKTAEKKLRTHKIKAKPIECREQL